MPLGDGADNRQEVGRFDDLPGPALGDARVWCESRQPRFHLGVAARGIVDLTGLVIRAAGNGERLAVHVVEAQVVIRTVCIPEERCFVWFWVWFPHRRSNDVARVQRKLGLEERRLQKILMTLQRVVRRHHYPGRPHRMRADLDAVVADLGFALFEHFASDVAQPRQQSSKILSRMELRLMLDAHGWRADERRLADEADVEAKALGKRHFIADSLMVVCERLFVSVDIGVKKSWNPRKVAVDVEPLDELIDLIDGRPPGIPHGLRVVLPQRRR